MELFGDEGYVIESKYKAFEILEKLQGYIEKDMLGSIEVEMGYTLASGVQVVNIVMEKYSIRNRNYMILVINVVDDGAESAKVFLNVIEREEGVFNLSLGKKKKIKQEITKLLTE